MTPRERADEVMDVTWGGWGSGDPWQQVPAFVTHRDRIEAAIIAAVADALARSAPDDPEREAHDRIGELFTAPSSDAETTQEARKVLSDAVKEKHGNCTTIESFVPGLIRDLTRAEARAEAAEKARAELNKVAKAMAGSYTSGQDVDP